MFTKTKIYEVGSRAAKIDANKLFAKIWRLESVQKYIIELNTKEQLFENSIDSYGKQLVYKNNGFGYSQKTYELKSGVKLDGTRFSVGQTYTLRDSGRFFKSFEVVVNSIGFEIIADGYNNEVFASFGDQVLGLTEESRGKLIEYILPMLADELEYYLLNG